MLTLFDLIVVAAIVGFAYWGWLVGLEAASVAALELVACLAVAVMLHEAVAGFLMAGLALVLGDWVSQAWSILLAFAGLAWGAFALLRLVVHGTKDDEEREDDQAEIDPLSDRLAGAVAGGFGGAVFVGGVLVTLSMVPFLAGLKPSGDRMLLDVGKTVLRTGGQFAGERHDGRSLPLWGEPPSRITVPTAGLTSEPWFDVDGDGKFTEVDRFRDVDDNDTFTKDLYFLDVDEDGLRRLGLVDKYVAGRWDAELISNDRPRPDLKKPTTPPAATPVKPPRTPAVTPAPGTPGDTTKPGAKPSEKPPAETMPDAVKPPAKPAEVTPPKPPTGDTKPTGEKPDVGKPDGRVPADGTTTDPKPEAPAPPPSGGKRPDDDF